MSDRDAIIAEVRKYLADIDAHASPDRLGGGRTELWLRALIEEVDSDERKRCPGPSLVETTDQSKM